MQQSKLSVKYSEENSVFGEVSHITISISILLTLKSINEFSGAASST